MTVHEQIRIWLEEHRGRNNPITSDEIKYRLELADANGNPRTRKLINDTIKMHGLPVVTLPGNGGYFWATNDAEFEEGDRYLASRQAGIERTRQIRRKNYEDSKK